MNPIRSTTLARPGLDSETIVATTVELGHEKCGVTSEKISKPEQKKGG